MRDQNPVLVILSPAFPRHEGDVNWVHSQQLFVKAIRKNFPGVDIIVLAFIYPYESVSYDWLGVKVISLDGSRKRKWRRLLLWRTAWRQLLKLQKSRKIQGILSFWCGECALVGSYFAKKYAINHKIWICGQDARKKNTMVKWIRPRAEELVAMSDFLADEFFTNHHTRPAHMILNGIDTSLFAHNHQPRDIDICGAGSLSVLKRYDIFVEAVSSIRKSMPSVKTVLCGDGEDMESIKKLVTSFSLQQNLAMTGMLTPEEVIRTLQRSRIFLHPSSYEGFSTACMEALYAGAHVISFVKPMNHDIKNWHVVKTIEEMIEKITTLLHHPRTDFEPVLINTMDASAVAMMRLFGIDPSPQYNSK